MPLLEAVPAGLILTKGRFLVFQVDYRINGLEVRICFLHIFDEHAKLSAPVADMVEAFAEAKTLAYLGREPCNLTALSPRPWTS